MCTHTHTYTHTCFYARYQLIVTSVERDSDQLMLPVSAFWIWLFWLVQQWCSPSSQRNVSVT